MRLDLLTVALACAAACSTAAPALAHHGSSVARVGGGASMAWTPASASVPPPRLDLGVSYSVNYFGRTLEGHSSVGGDGLGKVLVHLVTPSARLALRHGTTVGVALPVNLYLVSTGLDLSAMGNMSIMGVAWDPIWRSTVTAETYAVPVTVLVIIVALAVVYPALRAAFIKPLDAIRD